MYVIVWSDPWQALAVRGGGWEASKIPPSWPWVRVSHIGLVTWNGACHADAVCYDPFGWVNLLLRRDEGWGPLVDETTSGIGVCTNSKPILWKQKNEVFRIFGIDGWPLGAFFIISCLPAAACVCVYTRSLETDMRMVCTPETNMCEWWTPESRPLKISPNQNWKQICNICIVFLWIVMSINEWRHQSTGRTNVWTRHLDSWAVVPLWGQSLTANWTNLDQI